MPAAAAATQEGRYPLPYVEGKKAATSHSQKKKKESSYFPGRGVVPLSIGGVERSPDTN